ncbi:CHRD domain-containing protein [Arthrobacter sp. MDT1-65]
MISSDLDILCYDITLTGVTQPYRSPVRTATHIHQAVQGTNGPPRLAFPNPEGSGTATSSGCPQGPFTTGLTGDNGADTAPGSDDSAGWEDVEEAHTLRARYLRPAR